MLQLIGAELSPYTAKVKGYLRYKKIPFEPVLCTYEVMKNFVKPRIGWSVLPVVVTPDNETLQDSTDIINTLEKHYPEPSIYPKTPKQKLVSLLLEMYADEWLFVTAMNHRWQYPLNKTFLLQEFGKVSYINEPADEQRKKGEEIGNHFGGTRQFLGIDDNSQPEFEKGYLEVLDILSIHFDKYPYLLGYKPSIGDFAIFGQFCAMLFRDPEPGMIMKTRAPLVAAWVENMNYVTIESRLHLHFLKDGKLVKQTLPPEQTDFLANDEIPETLLPLLEKVFQEQGPVLIDTAKQLTQYLKENPDERDIPRIIGVHPFKIGNVTGNRGIFPYVIWMLQGVVDYYNGLSTQQKSNVDQFLAQFSGAEELVKTDLSQCRVERKNVHVCRAPSTTSKL
ncbi:uncharacterized protein [Ptychodera flava]|uniref:uncharacterized protein n=1 Tax=Ptychodera flava TaxID=63121 RepID=UPI003969D210